MTTAEDRKNRAIVATRKPGTYFYVTLLYSVIFIFLTWSFPEYFYFLPNGADSDIRPLLLVAYLITWPIAVIAPPLLLGFFPVASWNRWVHGIFLASVLLWPIVTLSIKLRGFMLYGDFGTQYFGLYPIFIFLEFIWPIAAVIFWVLKIRPRNSGHGEKRALKKQIRAEIKSQYEKSFASDATD
jgi:hypothetical protein